MKTIEELETDAEYYGLMVAYSAYAEEEHRREMLKAAADKIMYRQELDAVERALIVANGEPS
jgi:hypothetical protein